MNILAFLPELILFIGALVILMLDVFLGKKFTCIPRILFIASIIITITTLIAVIINFGSYYSAFDEMFISSRFSSFAKAVLLSLLTFTIFCCADFVEEERRISAEFIALMMLATLGGMFTISSHDLLPLYLGLELQALSLYLLAAIKRDSTKSSESGIKYFLLGSLASGLLLFGISLIYGFSGSTSFIDIVNYLHAHNDHIPVALFLGLILVLTAIFFKISAAPFHMWTPDVYEGSTNVVTIFFASAIKFITILILIQIYFNLVVAWPDVHQIVITVAILSLIVGSFAAIKQTNLKRMLAYSAVGHVGFILLGIAVGDFNAVKATVLYAVIYSSLSLGAFAFLSMLSSESSKKSVDAKNDHIYELSSIAGLAKVSPITAMAIATIMFSMAGIPPLAGFFAKLYILISVVGKGLYALAIVAVISSVISAFYYLRVVKTIYFDDGQQASGDSENDITLVINNASIVLVLMALANLLFIFYLDPLTKLIISAL